MKKGRSLETLVAFLEKQLNSDPDVIIESPKRLTDVMTGRKREHDVLLTYKRSHHKLVVAIEYKDRSRPVGVSDVEAFDLKCKHTHVNQGIIVSAKGFTRSALVKAKKLSLRCLKLEETDKAEWLASDASVVFFSKKFLVAKYSPVLTRKPDQNIDNYVVCDSSGTVVTEEAIRNNLAKIAQSLPDGELGKENTETLFFKTDGFFLRALDNDMTLPIGGIAVRVTYVSEVCESKFHTKSYVDTADEAVITKMATAAINLSGETKEVLITESSDGNHLRLTIRQE